MTESAVDIVEFLFENTTATHVTPANHCNADQKIFSNLPITISCFGVVVGTSISVTEMALGLVTVVLLVVNSLMISFGTKQEQLFSSSASPLHGCPPSSASLSIDLDLDVALQFLQEVQSLHCSHSQLAEK